MKKRIAARITAARRNGGGTRNGTLTPSTRGVTACSVCNLPTQQRQRIDRELIEESVSLGVIAHRVGCSKSSVKRHADRHLRPAVIAEIQRIENREESAPATSDAPKTQGERPDIRKGVRPVIERLYDKCAEWMEKAKDDSAWPMFVACAREARQSAELVGRLNGELAKDQGNFIGAVQIVVPASLPDISAIPTVMIARDRR